MNLRAYANPLTRTVNPNIALTIRLSSGSVVAADGRPVPAYETPGAFTGALIGNLLVVSEVAEGYLNVGQSVQVVRPEADLIIPDDGQPSFGSLINGNSPNTFYLNESAGNIAPPPPLPLPTIPSPLFIVAQVSGIPGGVGAYRVSAGAETALSESALINGSALNTFALNASGNLLNFDSFITDFVLFGNVQPLGWRDLQQVDALNLQGTPQKIYFYGAIDAIVRSARKGGDLVDAPDGRRYLITNVFEQWPDWCAVLGTLQNDA